jgi:hypothetical protein
MKIDILLIKTILSSTNLINYQTIKMTEYTLN